MSKISDALKAQAAKMQKITIVDGLECFVISRPIERLATEAIFGATNHQLEVLPPTENDALPYFPEDEDDAKVGKQLTKIVGKIATQRQYQAVLIGLQTQSIWRAMLSLIDENGQYLCKDKDDKDAMLQLLEINPEIVENIEKAVGWDKYDAEKNAATPKEDLPNG